MPAWSAPKLEGGDLSRPLRELMTPNPEVLHPDDPIVYALHRMSVGGYRHVPLVDDGGRPVGMLSVKDIVHYVVSFFVSDVLTLPLQRPSNRCSVLRSGST